MPSNTSGFSGSEIVSYVMSFIGNTSASFQSFLELTLPLAEFRFCKAHDWRFLHKQNLSLTVASGTNEYTLDSGTIGHYMAAEDVQSIFCPSSGLYLKKTTLDKLRRHDPEINDGTATAHITHWAPTEDNKIVVYPSTFADTTLKVDGKISPVALSTLSNYPTIPYRRQDAFIAYVIGLALDRENDDRANNKKQEALALIRQDIQDDKASLGDTDQPRIRSESEARADGVGANLEELYNSWMWNSD